MGKTAKESKVLVINGPNLNMLGKREPEIYGTTTLDDITMDLKEKGKDLGIVVDTFQSNHEGEIVERIHGAVLNKYQGVIINPGAFTHTSVAIRDALLMIDAPIVEIHLSNIYKREPFRHKSLVADIAYGQISGFGAKGYGMALGALAEIIS